MIYNFLSSFSTRDYAILTWSLMMILVLLTSRKIRAILADRLPHILKVLFSKPFIFLAILMVFNQWLIYISLNYFHLWFSSLFDEMTVSMIVAFSLLDKFTKRDNNKSFINDWFAPLTITALLEAIVDYQTYSFPTELLITFIFFIIGLYSISLTMRNKTNRLFDKFIAYFGLLLLFLALLVTYLNIKSFRSNEELINLLFPFLYPLAVLPMIYFIHLIEHYIFIFKMANSRIKSNREMFLFKLSCLLIGNISIRRVARMRRNFGWADFEKYSVWQVAKHLNNPLKLEEELDAILVN